MSSSRPSFHVSVEETAQSIRRRMHASFDEACRVQELLLDNSLHMRQVRARLMGRVNWNEGAITPDASYSLATEEDSNPPAAIKNPENNSGAISAPVEELFYGNLSSEEYMTMEEILDCMPEVTKASKLMVAKGYLDVHLKVTKPPETTGPWNCPSGSFREERIRIPWSKVDVYIWAFDDIIS
jgi:hypothetical protein